MAIDATVGGANSDSYVDVTDADAYHAKRLHNSDWTSAVVDTKERALKSATRLLELENWHGARASSTSALRWPRIGVLDKDGYEFASNAIPKWLKEATSELAFLLIQSDRTVDPDTIGFSKLKVGPIEVEVDAQDRAKVVPRSVLDMISPYTYGWVNGLNVQTVRT